MSVEKALNEFLEKAGISRYGETAEIAGLLGLPGLRGGSMAHRRRMDGGEIKGI
jgi:hypothetical protein